MTIRLLVVELILKAFGQHLMIKYNGYVLGAR